LLLKRARHKHRVAGKARSAPTFAGQGRKQLALTEAGGGDTTRAQTRRLKTTRTSLMNASSS